MYFYQALNQFGPSVVGFLVWEMSSPTVRREEQGEAAAKEQRGAGLSPFAVGWGHSTGPVCGGCRLGGSASFSGSLGCRRLCSLLLVLDGKAELGRGCGMGLWCPRWGLHRVDTAVLKILLRSDPLAAGLHRSSG